MKIDLQCTTGALLIRPGDVLVIAVDADADGADIAVAVKSALPEVAVVVIPGVTGMAAYRPDPA